jgi:hypothetical protein
MGMIGIQMNLICCNFSRWPGHNWFGIVGNVTEFAGGVILF